MRLPKAVVSDIWETPSFCFLTSSHILLPFAGFEKEESNGEEKVVWQKEELWARVSPAL